MSQGFLWGTATSAHQVEGQNIHNDWWAWEAKGAIDGGVRSGKAADHLRLFREDLRLAKDLGFNSYRFSFEWSRFEPKEGEWRKEACDWYHELISECEKLQLVPMATLHHFTSPLWFAEQGGFSEEGAPKKFANFVRKIAQTFGPRIPLWCTINEPMVLVTGTYLGRFLPPGESNPQAASRACYNLLKSHVLAYDILKTEITKREGPFSERALEVGFAHNMIQFLPERRYHPIECALAYAFSSVYNGAWLEAVNGGTQKFGFPGVFPRPPQLTMARGRKTYDFIGVNYYTKAYAQWRPRTQAKERDPRFPVGVSFAKRNELASDLGWAIHPQGLAKILRGLRKYKAPIYITENGIADGQDTHRRAYIQSHLKAVAEARESGLDIRGYYHWSLIDNFEWIKGFWPRFGLCSVDYDTFKRHPRRSAEFLRDLIQAHPPGLGPSSKIVDEF